MNKWKNIAKAALTIGCIGIGLGVLSEILARFATDPLESVFGAALIFFLTSKVTGIVSIVLSIITLFRKETPRRVIICILCGIIAFYSSNIYQWVRLTIYLMNK